MGKKFLPVTLRGNHYKVHLEDLTKIYRKIEKVEKPIPPYTQISILRKTTQETQPDT